MPATFFKKMGENSGLINLMNSIFFFRRRKTDCDEDHSDDDSLEETFFADFIDNELDELANHEGLLGTEEEDLVLFSCL